MKIYSVYDKQFARYGAVRNADWSEMLAILADKDCPEEGSVYVPSDAALEDTAVCTEVEREMFGGMPIQVGYCNGCNVKLNCLEFHKSSEIDLMESNTILLLGLESEIRNGKFNTAKTKAFMVPAGVAVELYATTLHYCPCKLGGGFRMVVILPRGTNYEKPEGASDPMLFGSNKWLLAHPDADEIKQGAYNGLVGKNLSIL